MTQPGSRTSDYDFELPSELIAQAPAERRDASRLLVVDRATGRRSHRTFADILEYIPTGDALVVNETRVFPARLLGRKPSGAPAEVFLLHPEGQDERTWRALVRPGGKLKPGRIVEVAPGFTVDILESTPSGERIVRLNTDGPVDDALQRYGEVPLPPYVDRAATEEDRERYQTVYARERGSVAAPTAGLHFTPELLAALDAKGVRLIRVVLHVGVGTFRPVEVDDPAQHEMHSEWYSVPPESAAAIAEVRAAGGKLWVVGTTVMRTLESVAQEDGKVPAGQGWTSIFIYPPFTFRAADHLITNFHLPKSTLMMLVAAFAGYDLTMETYREAVSERYRFFSYGDAMLLV
jgi:S-adenosylmethionine:tRNA ribosyltransferase-isomerase